MLFSFIALGIAIATFYLNRIMVDEASHVSVALISRFCLFISLIYCPWLVKLIIVAGILLIPVCTQRFSLRHSRCSRFCIARINCPHTTTSGEC